uniref:Uncharacterized protein n=1 Tax=Arundo donax TaxID=35708 RepID=A0A0A9DY29_ARUDO
MHCLETKSFPFKHCWTNVSIGLHKEGASISIISLSRVNTAAPNGPDPCYLSGLPFCKNPFPDWVITQRRHDGDPGACPSAGGEAAAS